MDDKVKTKGQLIKRVGKPPIPENVICKWLEVVNLMAEVIKVPAGLIMKVIPPQIEVFVSSASKGNPYIRGEKENLDSGLYCEKVMRERDKLLVPDVRKDPQWVHNPDIKLGMVSYLGFPLMWPDGEIFGTICVLDNKENYYCQTYEKLIKQFKRIVETDLQIIIDITEQKKVKEEKNKLLKAIETSREAINITFPDTIMIYTNDAMDKLFGYKKGELIGKHVAVLNAGATPEAVAKQIVDAVEKEGFWEGEIHNKRKDGTEFISYVRISALRDKQGKITNFVSTQHDITERKKADETLKESEQRYRTLFEKTVNPILVIDTEGNYIACNEAALRFVECTRDEFLVKNIRDFIPPGKERQVLKEHGPLWESSGTIETEYYVHGKSKILELSITPATCHGKRVVFGIGKDITDRKKAEKEKEKLQAQLIQSAKMAALGTLASGITHGFSNLLQIMVGHVAFAQRTKKREDMKHALNIVLDTSDRAAKIIKDLVTFSKPELSEKELCDITEPIESVLSLAEEQLKKHNIKVVRKYERTPAIKINKVEMQQIFLAIVINARDAMLPKGGKLEICVKQVKGNIKVSFSDTGKGIEKENLSKVFEPFYTTKGALGGSTIPGTGLGLSVSYGIIQRHKGTIEVNSQVGQGTTFTVKLPVKEVEPKERTVKEQKKREIENAQYMNILVMDDEEEICKILINWLSIEGHKVKSVLTGREAIELVKNEYFNVVFLDIIMPGFPGNIVLEKIKKISPETKVVMITGKLMNDYLLNKLIQKGASGCIQKPFGIEEIKEALV
ncbi:Sensor histidine kinase RcsC [subsurface metagenome]